jgi:hypothetical protein
MSIISAIISPASIADQSLEQIACPICQYTYTRLERIRPHRDGKDARLSAVLEFSCEQGCKFGIGFLQHKGFTLLELQTFNPEED